MPAQPKSSQQSTQDNSRMTRQRSSSQPISASQHLNKKQRAKERGRQLQQILREKRARGDIKKSNKPPQSKSSKAGIFFPVNNFLKKLKRNNPRFRVQTASAIMVSSVLEYLTAEILELAGNVSSEAHRKRIIPRDIFFAIKNDAEFDKFLQDTILVQSGTVPGIHPSLTKTSKIPCAKPKVESQLKETQVEEHEQSTFIDETIDDVPKTTSTPRKRKQNDDSNKENEQPVNESNASITKRKRN